MQRRPAASSVLFIPLSAPRTAVMLQSSAAAAPSGGFSKSPLNRELSTSSRTKFTMSAVLEIVLAPEPHQPTDPAEAVHTPTWSRRARTAEMLLTEPRLHVNRPGGKPSGLLIGERAEILGISLERGANARPPRFLTC